MFCWNHLLGNWWLPERYREEKGMSMSNQEMFEALHPDASKQGVRVTKATYDVYKAALLQVIPATEEGIAFTALRDAIIPYLPKQILENTSPGWWTTTVKLDLEAREVIVRVNRAGRQYVRRP
jgi:hypothetical protein